MHYRIILLLGTIIISFGFIIYRSDCCPCTSGNPLESFEVSAEKILSGTTPEPYREKESICLCNPICKCGSIKVGKEDPKFYEYQESKPIVFGILENLFYE